MAYVSPLLAWAACNVLRHKAETLLIDLDPSIAGLYSEVQTRTFIHDTEDEGHGDAHVACEIGHPVRVVLFL